MGEPPGATDRGRAATTAPTTPRRTRSPARRRRSAVDADQPAHHAHQADGHRMVAHARAEEVLTHRLFSVAICLGLAKSRPPLHGRRLLPRTLPGCEVNRIGHSPHGTTPRAASRAAQSGIWHRFAMDRRRDFVRSLVVPQRVSAAYRTSEVGWVGKRWGRVRRRTNLRGLRDRRLRHTEWRVSAPRWGDVIDRP